MKHIYYIFLLTVCFVISGCAGIQYADIINATDITQLDSKEKTARVLALADEWRNSGVIVKKGFTYKIAATGRWTAGPICGWTGPDGFGASPICGGSAGTYIGRGSASSLIGKIGEQGTPFEVGNKLELTAEEEGILFFRINDTPMWMGDNDGFANVKTALVPPVAEKTVQYPQEKPSLFDDKLPPIRPDTFAIVIGIDYKGRHDIPNL